jgi:adenylate cyclase
MKKFVWPPVVAGLMICISVFALVAGMRTMGFLEILEISVYDWLIRLQPMPATENPYVSLISVTDEDIRTYRWPLTDEILARALTEISLYEPRVIGLDIYRDLSVLPGKEELDNVFTENQNIIASMKFGTDEEAGIPPPPVLAGSLRVGFNDVLVDPGGVVRRGILFLDDGEEAYYSFDLKAALLYLAHEGIYPEPDPAFPDFFKLGDTTIPPFQSNDGGYTGADDKGYQYLLDFKRDHRNIPSFTLHQLLSGEIPEGALAERVVLLGFDSQGVKDFFYTPHSRGLEYNQEVVGIALHAQFIDHLIRLGLEGGRITRTWNERTETLWILLWCLVGTALGYRIRSIWYFITMGLMILLVIGLAVYLSFLLGWWIPFVPPIAAGLSTAATMSAYLSAVEKKQRAVLMQLFSKHVSPEIAENIWEQRHQFLEGGRPMSQKLTDTVLFIDLAGFTTVSEMMEPQQLIDWLNTYMDAMAQAVTDHGGVIDEFLGDGLKADFGVPLPRTSEEEVARDARAAVNCALRMRDELERLNLPRKEQNLATVKMRIGIYTGPVVAGSVGSTQRLQYTTIGDTVNIASRLEHVALDGTHSVTGESCRILIGETTWRYLGDEFAAERIGEVELKGKKKKINVFRIVAKC